MKKVSFFFIFLEVVTLTCGERRKPIDIEDRRTKVKATTSKKIERKFDTFFISAQ
jgi:hypothetical protein